MFEHKLWVYLWGVLIDSTYNWIGLESAARARGAVFRTVQSVQMIQSTRIGAETCSCLKSCCVNQALRDTETFVYEWC